MIAEQMPLNVTLMITEKCNLKCKYCYEVFSGNMKAQSMPFARVKQAIDFYMTDEMFLRHGSINWDLIGGEVFAEFDLLKQIIDYLVLKYQQMGLCPRKYLALSLCSNGTLFTEEVKAWAVEQRGRMKFFSIALSMDGIKAIHDEYRSHSFDRVMAAFPWWREHFPEGTIKGTICPDTLPYLFENVKFYVEDLQLPQFYINPTFEGPWNEDAGILYGDELIKCAAYFLEKPEYRVMNNSNLFAPAHIEFKEKKNWCGSGVHMRAISPDGTIYPCIRAATSKLHAIGHLDTGIQMERIVPFYFYTTHNDDKECDACEFAPWCPSCVMQWVEDTGDMYHRSKAICMMTKARVIVSRYFVAHTTEDLTRREGE